MKHCKLHVLGLAISLGFVWALAVFVMGILATINGYGLGFVHVISAIYVGYEATVVGSIIGAVWAFVDLFICGLIFAFVYNLFIKDKAA